MSYNNDNFDNSQNLNNDPNNFDNTGRRGVGTGAGSEHFMQRTGGYL